MIWGLKLTKTAAKSTIVKNGMASKAYELKNLSSKKFKAALLVDKN